MIQRLFVFGAILLPLMLGCSTIKDERIQEFENYLGPELSLALTETSLALDSFVLEYTNTEDIAEAYVTFLKVVKKDELNWDEFYKDTIRLTRLEDKMVSSGWNDELILKWGKNYEDEIFGGITSTYFYQPKGANKPLDTVRISTLIRRENRLNQHIIDSIINTPPDDIEYYGYNKLLYGLDRIKETTPYLISYLDAKYAAGLIHPNLVAGGLLNEKLDFKDYFVRRVLTLEFLLYKICK